MCIRDRVDIEEGNRAVRLMKQAVEASHGPDVIGGLGSFGGLFSTRSFRGMEEPVLVGSTDGVGTKTRVAVTMGVYDTVGEDLVNHCVNDILVQGAKPLFFLDYFAASKLHAAQVAAVVGGAARACRAVGAALLGGETAEMPGVYHDGEFDLAGTIVGVDLDTSHFTGNFPPSASIEGRDAVQDESVTDASWFPLLPAVNLSGNRHHYFNMEGARRCTHVRVNLYPDGGLARLRLYGMPEFDPAAVDSQGLIDLAAAMNGGTVVAANNQHFGLASSLLMPGRGVNMGDGWETRRRREPGHDWCIVALTRPGVLSAIEVDTCHFKGNFPDRCSMQAALVAGGTPESLVTQSMFWPCLLYTSPSPRDGLLSRMPSSA